MIVLTHLRDKGSNPHPQKTKKNKLYLIKVLYQELSLNMFIGVSTYFGVAWDHFELCGVYFKHTSRQIDKGKSLLRDIRQHWVDPCFESYQFCGFANYEKVH